MTGPSTATSHIFTVDVEEYFQVRALEHDVPRERWESLPSRVQASVDELLALLAQHGARGTFFTLGWVAERHPEVVRAIAEGGHELGSHGWSHRPVYALSPDEFRREVRSSKAILEDVAGHPVIGFRAPNFSITPGSEWAFDVLCEEGYQYDSSLFPIRRPGYGYPSCPPLPHIISRPSGTLCEFPLATALWCGMRLPAAGGAYFRHLPYALTRRAFRQHSDNGIPAVFYLHPWELDPGQPRLGTSPVTRMRHYGGLRRTRRRLQRLLAEFHFTSAASRLGRRVVASRSGPRRETPVSVFPE
ncbi:MAG TPA: XrtA system polysaccharide deacetylase [Gemmatimonadaceae bacterium]|nr:XrtA system polysaccharide deacetylase [Gemmatimonadaceae bacterium]